MASASWSQPRTSSGWNASSCSPVYGSQSCQRGWAHVRLPPTQRPHQQVRLLKQARLPRGWCVASESRTGRNRGGNSVKVFSKTRTIASWAAALGTIGESSSQASKAAVKPQNEEKMSFKNDVNSLHNSDAALATSSLRDVDAGNVYSRPADANGSSFRPVARDDLYYMMQLESELEDGPVRSAGVQHLLAKASVSSTAEDALPGAVAFLHQRDAAEAGLDDDWWQGAIADFVSEGAKQRRIVKRKKKNRRQEQKRAQRFLDVVIASTCDDDDDEEEEEEEDEEASSELLQSEAAAEDVLKAEDKQVEGSNVDAAGGLRETALVGRSWQSKAGVWKERKKGFLRKQKSNTKEKTRSEVREHKRAADGVGGRSQRALVDEAVVVNPEHYDKFWNDRVDNPSQQDEVAKSVRAQKGEGRAGLTVGQPHLSRTGAESTWHSSCGDQGLHAIASAESPTTSVKDSKLLQASASARHQQQGDSCVQASVSGDKQPEQPTCSQAMEAEAAMPEAEAAVRLGSGELAQDDRSLASVSVHSGEGDARLSTEPGVARISVGPTTAPKVDQSGAALTEAKPETASIANRAEAACSSSRAEAASTNSSAGSDMPEQHNVHLVIHSQQIAERQQHTGPPGTVNRISAATAEVHHGALLTAAEPRSLHQPEPHRMSCAGPSGSWRRSLRQWACKLSLSEWQLAIEDLRNIPRDELGATAVALLEAISAHLYKTAAADALLEGVSAVMAAVADAGLVEAGHVLNLSTFVLKKMQKRCNGEARVPEVLNGCLGRLLDVALKQRELFLAEVEIVRLVQATASLGEQQCKKVWAALEASGLPEGASVPAVCEVLKALVRKRHAASPELWGNLIRAAEAAALTARLPPALATAVVTACARACPARPELRNPFADGVAPSPLVAAVAAAIPALPLVTAAATAKSLWRLAPEGPLAAGASARVRGLLANGEADALSLSAAMAVLECCQVCQIQLPVGGDARCALEAAVKRTSQYMSAEEVYRALAWFRQLSPPAQPSGRLVEVLANQAVSSTSLDAPAPLVRCIEELSKAPDAPSGTLATLFAKADAAASAMSMRDSLAMLCAAARRPDSCPVVPAALGKVLRQADKLTLEGLQDVTRAIGVLDVQLCASDSQALGRVAGRLAPQMDATALSTAAWGLAHGGASIPEKLWSAFVCCGIAQSDAARVLWALGCARTDQRLDGVPLHVLVAAVAQPPIGFGTLLTALEGLRCAGLPLSARAAEPLIPVLVLHACSSTDVGELVALLQALSRARLAPADARRVYSASTAALQCALPSASPPQLLWALEVLTRLPEDVREGLRAPLCDAVRAAQFDGCARACRDELLNVLGWGSAVLARNEVCGQCTVEAEAVGMLTAKAGGRLCNGVAQDLERLLRVAPSS